MGDNKNQERCQDKASIKLMFLSYSIALNTKTGGLMLTHKAAKGLSHYDPAV
jgi:hypothetical protein